METADTHTFDVETARALFPSLSRRAGGRPFVWADAPGGSQVPETVIEAMTGRMRRGASNTHGAFTISGEIDELIDEAHRSGAAFLGCDPDEVIFGQNSTSLLLHLSRSFSRTLEPGDEVMVTRLDHDANVRPWVLAAEDAGATVRWVDVEEDDVTLDTASFDAALCERTRLVAFTLASNAVGTMPAAGELIQRAKAAGALVAVDGVHFAQHHAVNLHELGADLVATSPYKFFGPHQGMVGVRREVLDSWRPYKLRPVEDINPDRWETGTQSHESMAGTAAAIGYIASHGGPRGPLRDRLRAGFGAFRTHERALSLRFMEGLARIQRVRLFGIADPVRVDERTPTFAVRIGDQHPLETAAALGDRGIFVWDGHYYAIEVFDRLGLLEGGGAVRIGFCHYNTIDEVDRVLQALDDLAAAG